MTIKVYTETIRKIFETDVSMEVSTHPDNASDLQLRVSDDKNSIAYFGNVFLSMSPAFAMAIGKALIAAAEQKGAQSLTPLRTTPV